MKDLEVKDPIPPTRRIHKLVLTGGPCGGKTTGQAHLATFFESLGWKVFRVPETATVLMSGGISFGELSEEQVTIGALTTQLRFERHKRVHKLFLNMWGGPNQSR